MRQEITGERIEAAFFQLLDVTVEYVPGAWERRGSGGARLISSGSMVNSLNGVFREGGEPVAGDIAEYVAIGSDRPWSVFTRGEPSSRLRSAAAGFGLVVADSSPLLILPAGPVPPPPAGATGTVVRRLTGAESDRYVDTLAQGFDVPREVFGDVMSAPLLDAPGATAYLVEHDGEPVATAFGFLAGGLVGAYNIATPARFRRRGYGRLAVEAVLRDGFDAGADGAYLRSTEEGLPLYRSMGFRQIEQWTYLTSDRS
jgi:GNAT superfamily N-acetyltransferase